MAKAKMRRWICPDCGGGVLAPSKPRADDVRRFCLACSAKTGRLVPRACPALEAERDERARRNAERSQAKAKRVREQTLAARTVCGVNVDRELARILRIGAKLNRDLARVQQQPPSIRIRRFSGMPRTRLGLADYDKWELMIAAYPGQDAADVCETLVHEAVHFALCDDHAHHGNEFRGLMRELFEACYGVVSYGTYENRYHGRYAFWLRVHLMSVQEKRDLATSIMHDAMTREGLVAGRMAARADEIRRRAHVQAQREQRAVA